MHSVPQLSKLSGLGARTLAQFFDFTQQAMTKGALRTKLIKQRFRPIERDMIGAHLFDNLSVASLDFRFSKQNTLLTNLEVRSR